MLMSTNFQDSGNQERFINKKLIANQVDATPVRIESGSKNGEAGQSF